MLRLGDVLAHGWEASRRELQQAAEREAVWNEREQAYLKEQARMRRLAEEHRADKERAGRQEARASRRAVRRFMGRDS